MLSVVEKVIASAELHRMCNICRKSTIIMFRKSGEFGHVVFEICLRANRRTYVLVALLCICIGGKSTNIEYSACFRRQEAFEKCWAHSPLRAAARPNFTLPFTRCRYCRTPPLLHATCASMSTTTTTTRDRGDRYGPMEWA